jgi:hypothetical protein
MDIAEDLGALQLFNEKSAELRASRFVQMATHEDAGFSIHFGADKPLTVVRTGPDDEALRAFVLTFRLFIQDNEPCSVRNIAHVYERLDVPAERKTLVALARADLNTYLDAATFIAVGKDETRLTRRRIMDVFVYGTLAHNKKEKRIVLDSWRGALGMWPIIYNELVQIVMRCLQIFAWLEKTNIQTLEDLKSLLPQVPLPTGPLP